MRWILGAVLAVWIGGALVADAGEMVVVGHGVVDVVPDMATITVGVRTMGTTAGDALRDNSAATGEMLTLLSEMGIEQPDMQTSGLNLSPMWDDRAVGPDGVRTIVGYQVSNTVSVTVRSLGDLGVILDDIVQNGANEFYGLSFGVQEPGPARDDARRAAVADAARKAALYAQAAGVPLGAILSISEGAAARPGPSGVDYAVRSVAVPIASGEVSVSAQVTIIYDISGD